MQTENLVMSDSTLSSQELTVRVSVYADYRSQMKRMDKLMRTTMKRETKMAWHRQNLFNEHQLDPTHVMRKKSFQIFCYFALGGSTT